MTNFELLDNVVYTRLKQMIINREIKPGEIINQSKLSELLEVSRTPLRQALVSLETEGFLAKSPKGWYAKEFTIQDMICVFEIRSLLEALSCKYAATRLSPEEIAYMKTMMIHAYESYQKNENDWKVYHNADVKFHSMIIDAAGNEILKRTVESAQIISTSHIIAISHIPVQSHPERGVFLLDPKQSFEDHMEIIKAFELKDENMAEDAMKKHIAKALEKLKSIV